MTRLELRASTVDDLEVFYANEQDEDAARLVNYPLRSRERFMAHWTNKIFPDPACQAQTVVSDGEIAGNVVSWDQDGERMIGYWFGRAFRGRGIGTAAVRAFIALEPVRPLYADPSVNNVGSIRLLEKCGFKRVGSEQAPSHWGEGEVEHVMLKLD